MKVYVVTSGSYSDYGIDAIFSTREAALAYKAEHQSDDIEEYEMDERAGHVRRTVWSVDIDLKTGFAQGSREYEMVIDPNARAVRSFTHESPYVPGAGTATATSAVSLEHALKLAAEKRQEWLREKALAPQLTAGGTLEYAP